MPSVNRLDQGWGSDGRIAWRTDGGPRRCFYLFSECAGASAVTVFAWTIRQTLTPGRRLGRMNSAFRFIVTGIMPLEQFLVAGSVKILGSGHQKTIQLRT
jgi:hypothetical protein